MNGNTFDVTTVSYGHATKVWREIRHRFPAGGTITNVSDFVSEGKIPAGSPIKYDSANKTITVIKDSEITAASDATALAALGINAYLQEDAFITSANTIATGTAIYAGEIYEYMFDSEVVAKLKTLTTVPQIVWVQ